MADLKISQLTSTIILTAGGVDFFPIVQGGSTVRIDIASFFGNLPLQPKITQVAETVASGAVLSTATRASIITVNTSTYTLPVGTHGQRKLVVAGTFTAGTAVLTVAAGAAGFSTVTFNAIGNTVEFENVGGIWFIIGSRLVVIA